MFRVIEEAERARILDEALKGERSVDDIAIEAGVNNKTLFDWLERHYTENPDDNRRHLIRRNTGRWPEAPEDADAVPESLASDSPGANDVGADDNEARDDMGQKKGRKKGENPKRAPAEALLKAGELSQADIARKLGVTEAAVSYWAKKLAEQPAKNAAMTKIRAAVIADIKAGYTGKSLEDRHKKNVGKTTIYRWLREFREAQEARAELNRANAAKARAARKKLLENPDYREQARQRHWRNQLAEAEPAPNGQLPLLGTEQTQMSRPAPSERMPPSQPSSALVVVQHRAEFPPDSQLGNDVLRECIEERSTLRGMVTLLQREAEELKKQLVAYQRTFGDMRR